MWGYLLCPWQHLCSTVVLLKIQSMTPRGVLCIYDYLLTQSHTCHVSSFLFLSAVIGNNIESALWAQIRSLFEQR